MESCFFYLCSGGRSVGGKGEVSYFYFISKFRDPVSKRGDIGLEMLNLGAAWVIVYSGADGG